MSFKEGDKVKIMCYKYCRDHFHFMSDEMKCFCNKTGIIKKYINPGMIYIDVGQRSAYDRQSYEYYWNQACLIKYNTDLMEIE